MFDGNFREGVDKVTGPIGETLHRFGISADVITVAGVAMAAACGAFIASGHFFTAAVLLALTGVPDALDGAVAKASGSSGPRGAFFDSVADRLSDGLLFMGAAWYFLGTGTPRLALLPFGLFLAASLVSYQRAKAESLGFDAKGGLMERAERFIVLGFGLVFSPLFTAVLWVMLVLTLITVATRFVKVWKQASKVTPTPVKAHRPARSARVERVRARREARAASMDEWRTMARERMSGFRK
ncbi:MAG: CDP-alcohol phosphatidyltransferase family protein [Acidimicrobiales bacterium]|nr:CDP-alcohol phosphatidyltransferase family protein [Acidimicrobiales bacterium]